MIKPYLTDVGIISSLILLYNDYKTFIYFILGMAFQLIVVPRLIKLYRLIKLRIILWRLDRVGKSRRR
jgi:hypothetical protein